MSLLKVNWTKTTLGEVAKWSSGGTPKRTNNDYYCGSIPWVKTGDLGDRILNQSSEFITEEGLKNSSAKLFPKGSLGLAMYGATIGKVSIFGIEAACNQACAVAVPDYEKIHTDFLYYLLKNEKEAFIKKGKGGAQPNISQTIIKAHEITIPSIEEQKRIADKLDSVLAKVEAAQARLDKIPAILKRFRQSVLAAATSGELTKEWRDHRDLDSGESLANLRLQVKVKKNSNELDESKLRELPKGWSWAQVKEVGSVQLGRQRSPKYHSGENMRPYLRVMNVKEGFIDTTDIMEMVFDESDFQKYRLFPGDILLNEGQSYELVGRPAIYNGEVEGACFTNTLVRFRPFFPLKPRFSFYVFMTYMKNGRFQQIASRTVNISHLGAGRFSELEFPFPPVEEQEEIERKVEGLFSKANMVEKNYESAKSRLDSLSQAILSKAFKGELLTSPVESEIKEIESSVEAIHA
ncbi:restriction endonuclease subunit S [Alteromonas sp. S167]|uniref:restriction endonuclease subunit S n=1 Tax=Alteromonas sp. S167 TaxID=3117402 RepID=UPI002FE36F51